MDLKTISISIFLSLLPISELRGAIPYALAKGVPLLAAYPICVGFNGLVAPLVFVFLSTFNKLFLKMKWYERFFNRFIDRARHKVQDKVDRFGYFGIMLFVAIPLPITRCLYRNPGGMDSRYEPEKNHSCRPGRCYHIRYNSLHCRRTRYTGPLAFRQGNSLTRGISVGKFAQPAQR